MDLIPLCEKAHLPTDIIFSRPVTSESFEHVENAFSGIEFSDDGTANDTTDSSQVQGAPFRSTFVVVQGLDPQLCPAQVDGQVTLADDAASITTTRAACMAREDGCLGATRNTGKNRVSRRVAPQTFVPGEDWGT